MKLKLFGYSINITKELENNADMPQDLKEAIETIKRYGVKAGSTKKQREASAKATKIRQDRAKEKIINAINILRMENKPMSEYAIAKMSGCSINTIKRHRDFIEVQKKEYE